MDLESLKMKYRKSLFQMVAAITVATAAPLSHAGFMDTFQGLTFKFDQVDANTLNFNISGTPSGDWSTAQYLAAFSLKDLGINFSSASATANGPGASSVLGLNSELAASSLDCMSAGTPAGSICFDIKPDTLLPSTPFNLMYVISFTQNLDIATTGPHLKIAFSEKQDSDKVGSLYSKNVSSVPEPDSSSLMLLGLGLLGVGMWTRKRKEGMTTRVRQHPAIA